MKRLLLPVIFILISASPGLTAPVHRPAITKEAEIVLVRGDSWIRFVKEKEWGVAVFQQALTGGDLLKTGAFGKLDILFVDGTQIKVHSRTVLMIKETAGPPAKKGTVLGLEVGEVWSRTKPVPKGLRIETPSATAAIRGTDWDLRVDEKGTTYLAVLKGTVELFNDFGRVDVGAGDQAIAEIGKPPVKTFLVRPKERVQWTISYPLDVARLIPFYSHRRNEVMEFLPVVRARVEAKPEDLEAMALLAGLLFDAGEKDESLTLFERVLSSQPGNCRALTFKGLILLDRGEEEKASASLEQALQRCEGGGKTDALLALAGVYLARNEITGAATLVEEAARTDASPVVGIVLASFKAFQGEFTEAVEICSGYSARYPGDERFPTMAADFSLSLDEGLKAKEYLDRALRANPSSSSAYAILGRYHYLEGRAKEAERLYRKAVGLDPKNSLAISELGKLLMEKGHYEESMKELSKAIDTYPREASNWSRRGTLLNWVEDIKRARQDYEQATGLNPADYQSLDGLGFLALKEGKTDDAIQLFLKASILEPRFAEPHVFLAIAYYQLEDFSRALEELRLAEELDPRDPIPHLIAYLIYQDTYRPYDSIREAEKTLALIPNLKSASPVETTKKGLSNLGSSLQGINLTEWAASYANESFNPYDASSYFFLSKKFESNPFIFVSENLQGFLLNPLSITYWPRYQDIVARPQHNLSVNATLGDEDGGFSRKFKITQQGYLRNPWEMTYLLDWENHNDKGFRENGFSRGNFFTYGFGARPDYKNGFFIFGGFNKKTFGDPGTASRPDSDDRNTLTSFIFDAGYAHRFGPKNYLLANFYYTRNKLEFTNPDPLGSTGLSNVQMSLIYKFGLEEARRFFEKGVFDMDVVEGVRLFVTDSTGTLEKLGLSPLTFSFPSSLDTGIYRSSTGKVNRPNFQIKHLFDIGEEHEFSYGLEYTPGIVRTKLVSSITPKGVIGFVDDIFLGGPGYALNEMGYSDSSFEYRFDSHAKTAYFSDRWKASENLLVEAGLFYEEFNNSYNNYRGVHPRAGIALKLGKNHVLRAAYQKRVVEAADVTLAPVTTAGLFFDFIQLIPGSRISDYQIGLESRWTNWLFTSLNAERRNFRLSETGMPDATKKNRSDILSAAVNSFLSDRFAVFTRYKYTKNKNEDGIYQGKAEPLVPQHVLGAGIVWVSPKYVKATLSASYVAGQYGDPENTYKMPDYWTVDLSATWEPLKYRKHWMFNLTIRNIFNTCYETKQNVPAAGRSVFLTAEYRF